MEEIIFFRQFITDFPVINNITVKKIIDEGYLAVNLYQYKNNSIITACHYLSKIIFFIELKVLPPSIGVASIE